MRTFLKLSLNKKKLLKCFLTTKIIFKVLLEEFPLKVIPKRPIEYNETFIEP